MSRPALTPTSTAPLNRPIGVFDSGVGGLTVLAALLRALPGERFVYLGDTARVPYGSKPLDMVRGFASEIAGELVERGVKAIVIACNTASAASLPALGYEVPVPVWGVVEPGVAAALARVPQGRTIGVLGTPATVEARVYQDRLEAAGAATWARACPMFVPLVEEGLQDGEIADLLVDHYLSSRPELGAVILGCTHYPLLKPALRRALGESVALIDSSEAVARFVAQQLLDLGLLAPPGAHGSQAAHDAPIGPVARPQSSLEGAARETRVEYLVTGDVDVFMHTAGKLGGPRAPASPVVLRSASAGAPHVAPTRGRALERGASEAA